MRVSIIFCVFLSFIFFSCKSDYTPKPKAYFKINFPQKKYVILDNEKIDFSFKYPVYSEIDIKSNNKFIDVHFPEFHGTLHLTYVNLKGNLSSHIEQSRSLAYKHNNQADAISEQVFISSIDNVYGMLYDYSGITATSSQFYLTDSINHFFRGSFYFNTEINDSIAPINIFIKEDIRFLIESLRWK